MGVNRKRSTKMAPLALSTSYLTGWLPCGISIITLMSCGTSLPVGILEMSIVRFHCLLMRGLLMWGFVDASGVAGRCLP